MIETMLVVVCVGSLIGSFIGSLVGTWLTARKKPTPP
jgi:uncharacterized membrane protein YfcA